MRQPKILATMDGYNWPLFRADAIAGASVALVALPLCIAIAIASGSTPVVGLVTAVVGGFIISLTSGSRVQIGGPTGAFIVVVYGVIQSHGFDGLLLATMMAGVLLIVAGFFRAGRLIALVPEPVINGFTLGIAVIIAASQIENAFGLRIANVPAEFADKIAALWAVRATADGGAVVVTLLAIVLIALTRRWSPRAPALVVGVGAASILPFICGFSVETLASRFGDLAMTIPVPAFPTVSAAKVLAVLPSALTIAFLAGVESLLSAIVADRMSGGQHRPSAELLAQGYANVVTPLFGGLPVTGAIARTATNVRAGGQTPVAGMCHAIIIYALVALAAGIVGQMALAALAAVMLVTAWNMSEPEAWRHHFAMPRGDQLLFALTALLTIAVDLTVAIGAGVALGVLLRWWRGGGANRLWTPRGR